MVVVWWFNYITDSTNQATDQILKLTAWSEKSVLLQVASYTEPNRDPELSVLSQTFMHSKDWHTIRRINRSKLNFLDFNQ